MSDKISEQMEKFNTLLKNTKVSPKQLIFGLVIFFIVLTCIALILPEESQVVDESNNGAIKYSKEEQQSANDYIITMQATGLIKDIKNMCDDGTTGCFYFLIDENLWYNSTNYETKKMILNASEIYSYSKNSSYKFYVGRGESSGKNLYDVWGIKD